MNTDRSKRIFIVDDDEMLCEALKDHLTRTRAYEVHLFHTGEAALLHLDQRPDVIVLDYYLNTVEKDAANGMEILKAIRKLDRNIHVIMLSSQEQYGIALQTLAKGAEQYVIKDETSFAKIEKMIDG